MKARTPLFLVAALTATAFAQPAPKLGPSQGPQNQPAIPTPIPAAKCFRPAYTGFTAIDRASGVAKGKIVALRWREIELQIADQVKGSVATKLVARGNSCLEETVAVGDSVMILVDGANQLLDGMTESIIPLADARIPALTAFAGATTAAARSKALVFAIGKGDSGADAAATFLAGSGPDLNTITKAQKAELARAMDRHPTRDLAIALARLRVPLDAATYDKVGLKDDTLARAVATITDFEKETDTARLASIIETETDPARQVAALDRCDRIAPRSTFGMSNVTYTLRGTAKYLPPARMMVSSCTRKPFSPPPPMPVPTKP